MLLWECVWELCSTGNIGIRKDAALSGLWETWIVLQFYLHILSLFVTLKNIMSDTQAAKPAGTNCDSASTENNFLTNISQGKVARYGWMDGWMVLSKLDDEFGNVYGCCTYHGSSELKCSLKG